jgi:hypothetical protein
MIRSKRSVPTVGVEDRFEAIIASNGFGSQKANPKLMAGGVAVVVAGALLGALAMGSGRDSHQILVAARLIAVGEVMTSRDVRAVEVSGAPNFKATPPSGVAWLVDRVASTPIAAGVVLTEDQFRLRQSAPPGSALVGVVLEPGALPTPDLRYGDAVQVMVSASPNAVIDEPARVVTDATVWKVWPVSNGGSATRTVTLAIPVDKVPEVGDAAARNLIRLIVVETGDSAWPTVLGGAKPAASATAPDDESSAPTDAAVKP